MLHKWQSLKKNMIFPKNVYSKDTLRLVKKNTFELLPYLNYSDIHVYPRMVTPPSVSPTTQIKEPGLASCSRFNLVVCHLLSKCCCRCCLGIIGITSVLICNFQKYYVRYWTRKTVCQPWMKLSMFTIRLTKHVSVLGWNNSCVSVSGQNKPVWFLWPLTSVFQSSLAEIHLQQQQLLQQFSLLQRNITQVKNNYNYITIEYQKA